MYHLKFQNITLKLATYVLENVYYLPYNITKINSNLLCMENPDKLLWRADKSLGTLLQISRTSVGANTKIRSNQVLCIICFISNMHVCNSDILTAILHDNTFKAL